MERRRDDGPVAGILTGKLGEIWGKLILVEKPKFQLKVMTTVNMRRVTERDFGVGV